MSTKYETSEPILLIARRAKRGNGFLVSPFDDPANVAPCSSAKEIGEAIIEMIEDEKQPRCDMSQFSPLNQEPAQDAPSDSKDQPEDREDDEYEDDEFDDEDEDDPQLDLADQVLLGAFNKLISGAQSVSTGGHKRRKKNRRKR